MFVIEHVYFFKKDNSYIYYAAHLNSSINSVSQFVLFICEHCELILSCILLRCSSLNLSCLMNQSEQ